MPVAVESKGQGVRGVRSDLEWGPTRDAAIAVLERAEKVDRERRILMPERRQNTRSRIGVDGAPRRTLLIPFRPGENVSRDVRSIDWFLPCTYSLGRFL